MLRGHSELGLPTLTVQGILSLSIHKALTILAAMILLVRSRSADSEFVRPSLVGRTRFYTPLRFTLWHLGGVGSPRFGEREHPMPRPL